jgi:hypothetical protein
MSPDSMVPALRVRPHVDSKSSALLARTPLCHTIAVAQYMLFKLCQLAQFRPCDRRTQITLCLEAHGRWDPSVLLSLSLQAKRVLRWAHHKVYS